MIHIHTCSGTDPNSPEPRNVKITLTEKDMLKFQALLNRALNCAPEFGKDWFELSDRLDQFLLEHPVNK
jgi:hypothetical protein